MLAALVSGEAAKPFEEQSLETATSKVMSILRTIFAAKNIAVPEPVQVLTFALLLDILIVPYPGFTDLCSPNSVWCTADIH